MQFRDYTPEDRDTVMEWFSRHGWASPPTDVIPVDGLIVEDICCSWIYFGEPRMAFIGWPVTNPDAPRAERYEGLQLILKNLIEIAKVREAKLIFAWAKQPGLLNLYEKLGFITGDTSSTNMIMGL